MVAGLRGTLRAESRRQQNHPSEQIDVTLNVVGFIVFISIKSELDWGLGLNKKSKQESILDLYLCIFG